MNFKLTHLVLILLSFQLCTSAQEKYIKIDSLAWLSGCWESEKGEGKTVEQWMKPSEKIMVGMSRTVFPGKGADYEFLLIREDEDGDIYYTALPSGQNETTFRLIKINPTKAVFENKEHDFPQRIIYYLEENGSLTARIEGTINGVERFVNFPMKRVDCN